MKKTILVFGFALTLGASAMAASICSGPNGLRPNYLRALRGAVVTEMKGRVCSTGYMSSATGSTIAARVRQSFGPADLPNFDISIAEVHYTGCGETTEVLFQAAIDQSKSFCQRLE
jgi:hypothetical protein